jgi:hypothetical protein
MTPILEAIIQNTPGYSQAYPAGVPRTFSWCAGTPGDSRPPPPDFTAVTAWAQVYPRTGADARPAISSQVEVAHAQTYVRLKQTNDWIRVQDQERDAIEGGHFVVDFAGNRAIPMTIEMQPHRTASMEAPPPGYNNHFWISPRGAFSPNSVDGVYVQMQVRAIEADAQLVANVGADWWRDGTVDYVAGFTNNPGAGVSNWVTLGKEWSTLYFYSLSSSEIQRTPPPPLQGDTVETKFRVPSPPPGPSPCRPIERGNLPLAASLEQGPKDKHAKIKRWWSKHRKRHAR